jgi:hypothetical protein
MTALATITPANRAFFAIQHKPGAYSFQMWMTECGNLQAPVGAILFETREEAQRFLDTRRLRRGFRPKLAVAEVSVVTIRDLANTAQEFAVMPSEGVRDDRSYWAARAAYFEAFLPLAA